MIETMLKRIDLDQEDLERILEKHFHDRNPETVKIEATVYASEDYLGNKKIYAKVLMHPAPSRVEPMDGVDDVP